MIAEATASTTPLDVTDHLWIPMPDGVRLAARLWLPQSAHHTPAPAVFEYIPYRKTDMVRARDERNHPFFAEHGYACLRVDMRGSGDSEGHMDDMYSDLERTDAHDVIAWIAAQPWCNGRIGMFGTSWGGTAALQANVDAPEALQAIIAVCATHDRYEDDIHHMGGCLLTDSIEWGATLPVILGSPPTTHVGDDWQTRWEERLANLAFPLETWVREETQGDYWRRGSVVHDADRLRRPILAIGGWSDRYSNSVMSLLSARPDLVWGLVGPWGHHYPDKGTPGPAAGFQQLALVWWNSWLRDPVPAPPKWPRLRAWLSEFDSPADKIDQRNGCWIQSEEAIPDVQTKVWHLDERGLSQTPSKSDHWTVPFDLRVGRASGDTGYFGRPGGEPLDQRDDDALSLTFDSPPLTDEFILLGATEAILALLTPRNRQLALRLNDVAPDGTSARVVWTVQNLSINDRDAKTSDSNAVKTRKVQLTFPTKAYRFRKGHRIRLSVTASYWPIIWPSSRPGELFITSGLLRLPTPPAKPKGLKHGLPSAQDLPRTKQHHIVMSSPLDRVSCTEGDGALVSSWHQPYSEVFCSETEASFGFETRAVHRAIPQDPLSTDSTVEHRAVYKRPDGTAEVRCIVSVKSDNGFYYLDGTVNAEWEEKLVAVRNWKRSIPRRFG